MKKKTTTTTTTKKKKTTTTKKKKKNKKSQYNNKREKKTPVIRSTIRPTGRWYNNRLRQTTFEARVFAYRFQMAEMTLTPRPPLSDSDEN